MMASAPTFYSLFNIHSKKLTISVSSYNKNRNLSFLMTKFPISTIFRH